MFYDFSNKILLLGSRNGHSNLVRRMLSAVKSQSSYNTDVLLLLVKLQCTQFPGINCRLVFSGKR